MMEHTVPTVPRYVTVPKGCHVMEQRANVMETVHRDTKEITVKVGTDYNSKLVI